MSSFLSSPAATATTTTALLLLLFLSLSLSLSLSFPTPISSSNTRHLIKSRRTLLSFDDEDVDSPISKSKTPPKKKLISEFLKTKNKTTLLKPKKTNSTFSSSLSSTTTATTATKSKLNKILSSTTKSKLNKTLTAIPAAPKFKLNKTDISGTKTSTTKLLKPIKPLKSNSTKIALKSNSTKIQQPKSPIFSQKNQKNPETVEIKSTPKTKKRNAPPASWLDDTHAIGDGDDDDDLISEFRELPSRLHSALVPDLEMLSTTSKLYISKTHSEIAAGVKPFVGKKYAPSIASAALLVTPLLLVTAIFRKLILTGSSASLLRALLFAQAYLAIYFATLSLTAVVTGLEPLRFFYAASPSAYAWTQAVQTFGYAVYLIAQLIAMVVAFSGSEVEDAMGKAVGLAQMLLGLAVGMHYYIMVFHRAVTGEAPRANWKVHGIYAACFVVICGLGRAERRKKAYMPVDGADDGKKS